MNQIPTVERWWREFRDQHNKALSLALSYRKQFMEAIGRTELPAQVIHPAALFANVFPQEQALQNKHLNLDPFFWAQLHGAACYRKEKVYWVVDSDLYRSLVEQAWPADTPAAALLYLPNRCAVLEIEGRQPLMVYYDLATGREGGDSEWPESGLELRLATIEDFGEGPEFRPIGVIPIGPGSLNDALDTLIEIAQRNMQHARENGIDFNERPEIATTEHARKVLEPIINLLLYAAGNDDLTERADPWPSINKKVIRRHADDKHWEHDVRQGTTLELGVRYGSAIRQYRDAAESGSSGHAVRPHIRAAHPHLYWTGEGRKVPKVRYLAPIAVHGGAESDERGHITKRRVEPPVDAQEGV